MIKNIFCSRCFQFDHTKHECKNQLPPVEHFFQELNNRVSIILEKNKNFADSEDEFGRYQKLSNDSQLKKLPIEYSLQFTNNHFQNLKENDENFAKLKELGFQLNQIYENNLKPTEKEIYLRFWSISKITRIIEWVCPDCFCIPQGSSLNGSFLSTSDVDLMVFNIDNDKLETIYNELEKKISDESGNLNEIIGNLKFYPRKRISFIGITDKETGINYEIIPGNVGGIFCAQRMKKFFEKFENLNLKKISMLVKSFINGIEGGKIFTGGFSSTMIIQLCQFLAMRHESQFNGNQKIESALLFIEILDFLSNLKNFENVVICASPKKGEFFTRPDNLKGKPFLIMMDSTEKNSVLMGNISEKTKFISDQSNLFLDSFLKKKENLISIFPGFSISSHFDESTLNKIFSNESINIDFSISKSKTIHFNKKFIENYKLFLIVNNSQTSSSIEIKKFCVDFFKPESIFEWSFNDNNYSILKYDKKYQISVDLIHELKTKEKPECLDELDTEEFIKKFPSFDTNVVCEHESFIKTIDI